MKSPTTNRSPVVPPWVTVAIIITVFWGSILWCIVGVTGYFRLSSETAALRTSFMNSVPGVWDKKLSLRVGGFTTGVARLGSRFFNLPPEPRAALDALRGADVGIYRLGQETARLNPPAILRGMDDAMRRNGWDRIVGVAEGHNLVAVYFPRRVVSPVAVKCCVLVFQDGDLVVTSVRGNLNPLLNLAAAHLPLAELKRHLAAGN